MPLLAALANIMNIEAQSKYQLAKKLADSDITVLSRGDGRTKNQVERWVMYRALATLLANDQIDYPVALSKRERPDYLLNVGDKEIGCEVTEAINGEYLKAQSLPEASADNSMVDVSLFKWGTQERSLKKLRQIASRDKLSGPGWAGNSVEREYAKIVYDVTQSKTTNMAKPGYERFDENHLFIYCNQSLPILNISDGAALCSEAFSNYWSSNSFDRVFVEKGKNIVIYSAGEYQILPLNELWKNG